MIIVDIKKGDFINLLHVGIDDTDSPDGMCTTYLATTIINELKKNKIKINGFPRLIRLNPFAKFKTRGNGAISFKIAIFNNQSTDLIKEIVLSNVEKLSMTEHENTNPGVVFYQGKINKKIEDYSLKSIHSIITIEEAEKLAKEVGAEIHKFKKGRGIIGSLAAIGCPLEDHTYELITYRTKKNHGTKRAIKYDSVISMNTKTYPETFENIDDDYIAIEPKTSCPVLYGIRGETPEILKIAKNIVKVNEPIEYSTIFKTNQHTDIHLKKVDKIDKMEKYGSYIVNGTVTDNPHVITGGHVFFRLSDNSGEIEASAYEPTKDFRKTIKKLIKGDQIQLFGGVGCGGTFNIEKIKILSLNKKQVFKNPKCKCGKTLTSAGFKKGFKCKKCGFKLPNGEKIVIIEDRELVENSYYETPTSARRHLSKPLIRN
ncbi:MAG: tRNA(Ile)(2)-agmatinylcytidine synthase [Methanobrevibacter sp.]|jgi:tRNA(Ile2)-agmatinylcytidine synthase|nr:tRNA(Ile)(2)-agmatinylcytidine synthase [Candidatus Methanovirga aequatorialis]